jgi:hypothetical protein
VKKKNYIYLGGGIDPITFVFLSTIIEGYNYEKKDGVIIDKSDFLNFKSFLKKTKIKINNFEILSKNLVINNQYKCSSKIFIILIINLLKNFLFYLKLLLKFSYKDKSNYSSAFTHSYWDSCIRNLNDNKLKPNFFIRLKTLIKLIWTQISIKDLMSIYSVKSAFLGHSVYIYRIILEEFKKKNIKTFIQANYSLISQKKKDIEWSTIDNNLFKKIKEHINIKKINKFWNLRSLGKLDDADFIAASKIKSNLKFDLGKNVIFLHVFKDSPFASIDKSRIFFDYFNWIIETIKILKESDEFWSIRIHPNSKAWGENSLAVLNQIKKKYFKSNFPSNIKIDNSYHSNLKVFSKMRRCITFSGTSSVEASCYGVKPIIIADNALSKINSKNVLKPASIKRYRELLLKKSSDKIFIQNKKAINDSKFLLYSLYYVLSFRRNLIKNNNIYFSKTSFKDKKKIFYKLVKILSSQFVKNKFKNLGVFLKKKHARTLNLKFVNLLNT